MQALNIKQHIPNTVTAANLFCGCLAVVFISKSQMQWAAYMVFAAAILDFFDGMVARLLNVTGELGKQLDSMADMVSFGLIPGYMVYTWLTQTVFCEDGTCWKAMIMPYYGFLITIFSAVRLANFNIDTRQTQSFIGVPTPANALMIASLALMPEGSFYQDLLRNHYFLTVLSVVMSYLLVAEIPLFALKFKHFRFKDNEIRFVFIGLCLLLFGIMLFEAVPILLILYVLLSVIINKLKSAKNEIQS